MSHQILMTDLLGRVVYFIGSFLSSLEIYQPIPLGLVPLYIICCFSLVAFQFSLDQFSRSVVADSLRPHEPQHATPPFPLPTPGIHPNLYPLSW